MMQPAYTIDSGYKPEQYGEIWQYLLFLMGQLFTPGDLFQY